MTNLVGMAEHSGLQKELEAKLQSKLDQTGDQFLPMEQYLEKWGYTVDEIGCIGYFVGKLPDNFKVQSPARKPKK